MKPEIGKQYTDRNGFTVTILDVKRSGGGPNSIGGQRSGKLTGYSLTIDHKGISSKMALRTFTERGFKETTA